MKWGWLFRTYVQWHAIAFLLSELCVRTKGEAVERAWRALEATAGRWWFPLNDTSPYRKGQQGCLWKPLRKLLAKAKAARAKELALEQASQALRNGPPAYNNYTPGFGQMHLPSLPPVSASQTSSEDLDKMLRPTAPRLGDMPPPPQPSWPSSPALPNTQGPFSASTNGEGLRQQQNDKSNSASSNNPSPGQEFRDLASFGLDSVVVDVMDDLTFEGKPIHEHPLLNPPTNNYQIPGSTQSSQPPMTTMAQDFSATNNTSNGMNDFVRPTFGDNMFSFPGMDFNTVTPTLDSNGQQTESPIIDGGNMDWTLWDDMVNQYGIEGQSTNPVNSAGPGHLGMVHWF